MKLNLLEIVQSVMNAMDLDLVSSLADLEESEAIALEAKNVYYDMMHSYDWEHLKILTQLDHLGSSAKPNYMRLPSDLTEAHQIRYNVATASDTQQKWKEIPYLIPNDFLIYLQSRDSSASNIQIVSSFEGVPLFIRNDIGPTYWTSFDDDYIVFDSFDSGIDSTLQNSKSSVLGVKEPTWTNSDSFIPDLPSKLFPVYLAELKRVCFTYFKDTQSPEDVRRSFKGLATQVNKNSRANIRSKVRYGRK